MKRVRICLCMVAAVVAHAGLPAVAADPPPPLPLPSARAALDGYMSAATAAVRAADNGGKLPFVGRDEVYQGSDFLAEARTQLGAALAALPDGRSKDPAGLAADIAAVGGPLGLRIAPDFRCGDAQCSGAAKAADVTRVLLTLDAGRGSPEGATCSGAPCPAAVSVAGRPFEVGLPGLQFTSDGTVTSTVSWHLKVTVGVDGGGAFVATGATPELRVGLDVALPARLEGTLGVVAVGATVDGPINGHGGFQGTFAFDAVAPGGEVRSAQAGSVPTTSTLTATADARIHAEATAESSLPGIGADLHVHWSWTPPESPASASGLAVSLENVHVSPGDFLGRAVKPMLDGLRAAVQPIAPVAEALNTPIPGVSEVLGDTSLIDLARAGAGATKDPQIQGITQLIAIASKLTLVVDHVDNGKIRLGDVVLDKAGLFDPAGRPIAFAGGLTPILDACAPCREALDRARQLIDGGPKLSFPLLDSPSRLIGVLVGNPVDLVKFDSGVLDLTNDFGGDLPDGSFAGYGLGFDSPTIAIHGRVVLGYDTGGMRDAIAGGHAAALADGLWVDGGSHLDFGSGVRVKLTVGYGVVTASIRGGPTIEGFGKVRNGVAGGRVRPVAGRPACSFELGGRIAATIDIVVEAIFTVVIPIVDHTLVDFGALSATNCANPNARPVLAHLDGAALVLNVGNFRDARNPPGEHGFEGRPTDNESARVTAERRGGDANQVVRVDLGGFTDRFVSTPVQPITQIVLKAEDHLGRETLVTATEDGRPFDLDVFVRGAQGGNTVTARTDASHHVGFFGSDAADKVVTGDAADVVAVGGGDDNVKLGKGVDTGIGGLGNDVLDGGPGTDDLRGEAGDDVLIAGNDSSSDVLVGGVGKDSLSGSAGADLLSGDECNGSADGLGTCVAGYGQQPDFAGRADGGSDLIIGGGGRDTMVAGAGHDEMVSGSVPAGNGAVAARVTAYGGSGNDLFVGGPGPDTFFGGPGDDSGLGGGDSDVLIGSSGNDVLGGGNAAGAPISPGHPVNLAPLGPAPQSDQVRGGPGNDNLLGGSGADLVEGGPDVDVADGGDGDDLVLGGSQAAGTPDSADTVRGGPGADVVIGDNGDRPGGAATLYDVVGTVIGGGDSVSGDAGADTVLGGPGADSMQGGEGDDRIEGGAGADSADGGDGQDDILGGSSQLFLGPVPTASVADVGDLALAGGAGHDVLLGDNGSITRGPVVGDDVEAPDRVSRVVRLLDSGPSGTVVGGGDQLAGGSGHDLVWGQVGDDVIAGDDGNDVLEGNQGADTVHGGAGQDDIVGGTTPAALPPGLSTAQFADTGDTLLAGDAGHDAILGDNGSVARGPVLGDDPEAADRVSRTVRMLDSAVGGPDRISGGAGHDLLWGEVADDLIAGDDGNDALEGNQGADVLDGGAGQDDVVGGTTPAAIAPQARTADFADAGDVVAGGDGSDLLVGDNAEIAHPLGGDGRWQRGVADGRYLRAVTLADRTAVGGPDVVVGGGGNDDGFGGLGDDRLHGGPGQDYLEGNQGADVIDGSAGDDDIVGGTSPIGVGGDEKIAGSIPDGSDIVHGRAPNEPAQIPPSGLAIGIDTVLGGDGLALSVKLRYGPVPEPAAGTETDGDVVAGDNARIDRCRPGGLLVREWRGRQGCAWSTTTVGFYGPTTARWVQQLGQPLLGVGVVDEILPGNHSGNDLLDGDDGDDLLLGQGGSDTIHGGAGDDVVYGGIGVSNKLYGDGGGVDVVVLPPDLSLLAVLGVVV
jgi:Ca2+-binding RTX toxin-like protein